ncbi:hypothetical protein BDQ12DRAFT_597801 [Crucibulum laeve]|uniref:Outer spore wall protein RRT8 n=1 Tax=Crucibulum laeve TaxID=68775 RepID=A0A5C3MDG8_9AGAR|nr:hypothetical protein BDQ12DRAFT_597801 [Crucibulum laeve]
MSSNSKSTADITKSIIAEKLTETAVISRDAVLSRGWSYPLLGITYFISHPSLYRAVAPTLVKALATSVGITMGLFFFTYLPQVAFCALFSGPFAFFTAALMVFSEAYVLITMVSKAFFLSAAQDRIFDAVLIQQGNEKLVSRGREVRTSSGFKTLGKSVTKPLNRLSKEGILRYIISLPLNSIPAVGTVLFLLYNGTSHVISIKAGPGFHARYFQLKGLDAQSREAFVEKRKGAYTAFGATALALNLIPLAGLVFGFTSTVGAALWANQLEKSEATVAGSGRHVEHSGESAGSPRLEKDEVRVEL